MWFSHICHVLFLIINNWCFQLVKLIFGINTAQFYLHCIIFTLWTNVIHWNVYCPHTDYTLKHSQQEECLFLCFHSNTGFMHSRCPEQQGLKEQENFVLFGITISSILHILCTHDNSFLCCSTREPLRFLWVKTKTVEFWN